MKFVDISHIIAIIHMLANLNKLERKKIIIHSL